MKRILALLLSAALLLLCGCGGKGGDPYVPTGDALQQEEAETTAPDKTETAKGQILMPYYPAQSMNPYECTDFINKTVLSLLYQGLFAMDQNHQSWPILCQNYQVSWDLKTYTFTLADATFSDGTAVTAADVEASLKAAKSGSVYKGRFNHVDKISANEDGTVEIRMEIPCESLPLLLDVPIVKASEVEAEQPLGTGPYVMVPGELPILKRRSDWWCDGGVPVIAEQIRLHAAGKPSELRDGFEFANLSLVTTDPGSDTYADFHSDHELWESESGILVYLACNENSQVLTNEDIRRELLQAIDREGIIAEFYHGFATSVTLPASPNSPYYNQALANQYPYDPMRLTQAVEEYRDKATQEAVLLVNDDDGIRFRVANKIAQDLNNCGMKVRVNGLPTEEYVQALKKGEFDLHLGQTRLSPNMDLTAFFEPGGKLDLGGMGDAATYSLCLDALANRGNYYNLHQKILEDGMLCPILFRGYAIYTQRGSFRGLTPARDNLFFYHLGRTMEDALVTEEGE